jgi:anaerobic magnesium-protoporphyrin IX monomethyl ester cyclase
MGKRLIFVARWEIIEPLGVLYLLGVAKTLGWEVLPILIDRFNFTPLYEAVESFHPDLVCFSIWTGYHLPVLGSAAEIGAADKVRSKGIRVAIGGPHATFSPNQCLPHADWVIKGDGFRLFRQLLEGELSLGLHFDPQRDDPFPFPDRESVYSRYEDLRRNPIRSLICSTGCPFQCTYCYAPHRNAMIAEATGEAAFRLELRSIDDIIREALHVRDTYGARMFYMQDDIFGFRLDWLADFARRWPKEVGIPWHCQIRLEMTREERRLDLFAEGGCTGVTIAIESGNEFLRRHVLFRPMSDELIVEGIRRIQRRGLTVRTEQILQVPFSDLNTDLGTLALNERLGPSLAWASILSPYGGTNMGSIATKFGFFSGDNDSLRDTFFDRSVLRHTGDGREVLEPVVNGAIQGVKDHPLLRMDVDLSGGSAEAYFGDNGLVGLGAAASQSKRFRFSFLGDSENDRYCDQGAMLQRLFNWAAKVPEGHRLMGKFLGLPKDEWTWQMLGDFTGRHLISLDLRREMYDWEHRLAEDLGVSVNDFPAGVDDNPWYFVFLPGGAQFAIYLDGLGFFEEKDRGKQWDVLGRETRRWLYDRALYRIIPATEPIANTRWAKEAFA